MNNSVLIFRAFIPVAIGRIEKNLRKALGTVSSYETGGSNDLARGLLETDTLNSNVQSIR